MIDSKELTTKEVQEIGLTALQKELGTGGMVRFLRIYSKDRGDYTKEREKILEHISFDDFVEKIKRSQNNEPSNRSKEN